MQLLNKQEITFARVIRYSGIALVLFSLSVLLIIFLPIIISQVRYLILPPDTNIVIASEEIKVEKIEDKKVIHFENYDFGIIVPKIGTNAAVVSDVDPFNEAEYTQALDRGIAHAKGTPFPGEMGNTFLFAHSAVAFYEASQQNVQFYLLSKVETNDEIFISYKKNIYKYKITEVSIVEQTDVKYLASDYTKSTITLMTCWPAGTNYKRVIVKADLVK